MAERTDSERLDWLEAQGWKDQTSGWIARRSTAGRGYRLHETTRVPCYETAREAIDAAMDAEENNNAD